MCCIPFFVNMQGNANFQTIREREERVEEAWYTDAHLSQAKMERKMKSNEG